MNILEKVKEVIKNHEEFKLDENQFKDELRKVASEDPLRLKLVKELRKEVFRIPSYQRGYRWGKDQVKALIDDISNFAHNKEKCKDEFYCLQPIVVKPIKEGKWEVIDGQQRLTTLFLVLNYLGETNFTLEYDSRDTLTTPNNPAGASIDDIDEYHIKQAWETIQECLPLLDECNEWKEALLEKTKVIWYEPAGLNTESDSESIKIFSRLNVGKIPLTNSELIRALFILKSQGQPPSELNEYKIATEWDFMEKEFHDEDFWNFVMLGEPFKKKYPNRIEILFDLIADIEGAASGQEHSTFVFYNDKLVQCDSGDTANQWQKVKNEWQKVKNIFYRLHEWFVDDKLYHRIGLLRLNDRMTLPDLLGMGVNNRQSELTVCLTKKVADASLGENVILSDCDLKEEGHRLSYGNNSLKMILVLHNIASYERQGGRFSFRKYTEDKWDIEHVHASADKVAEDQRGGYMKCWISYFKNKKLEGNKTKELERLVKLENDYKDSKSKVEKSKIFEGFRDASKSIEEVDNSIWNLVLLDRNTNRSFKDNPFPSKRKEILDRERKEKVFIPVCTRNVFTKIYSYTDDVSSESVAMDIWSIHDREAYLKDIATSIQDFKFNRLNK